MIPPGGRPQSPRGYAPAMRTGELSWWWRSLGGPGEQRPALDGPLECDVAIVGAGLTGLWTAYYLKRADPSLRVAVLEREHVGFGASGRNGGWICGFFSGPAHVYDRRGGPGAWRALQRELFATIEEIARVVEEHGIDAELRRGGELSVAIGPAQLAHMREHVEHAHELGLGEEDLCELSPEELSPRIRVAGALGASFTPHAARVHPAKLVTGLARVVADLGVEIYEGTRVLAISPRTAICGRGAVRARWIVRATEGYTPSLRGMRRDLAAINSSMIVTEPLPASAWEEIGWEGGEVLGDSAHVYIYAQRTLDGRIAIGGRGIPYRYGSRNDGHGQTAAATVASLRAKLGAMFPAAAGAEIEHAWSGVLGVSRDWCISANADPGAGIAWAGGYAGQGVGASNLAGRTLCELTLGGGALTSLPWVGHRPHRWEPEPLRWAAIHGVYALYRAADRAEERSGRPSPLGALVDRASGRV